MKIDDDDWDSHSIMRKNRVRHSLNYLKWSKNSVKNFREYFRYFIENKNIYIQ